MKDEDKDTDSTNKLEQPIQSPKEPGTINQYQTNWMNMQLCRHWHRDSNKMTQYYKIWLIC